MFDGLEKKIKQHALVTLRKAYLHIWGDRGYEMMIRPPIYKLDVVDLALSPEDKLIRDLVAQGKSKEEILAEAEKRGLDKKKVDAILQKLADREKIKHLLREKYKEPDEEDLDRWQVEVWAAKTDNGWFFMRYRCPKGTTLADKLSFIKYRYLDTGILIRLNLAINAILLMLLVIMALGYQYPIVIHYLQTVITTRDMFWMAIVIGLLYILVTYKLNEEVLYANFLFLSTETMELPVRVGSDVIVAKVHTIYLYQSDSIPPAQTDVFLVNTEVLSRRLQEGIIREFLNALKENLKLSLRIEHLMEELKALRSLLDDYKKSIDEAYLLGLAVGVKQRKAREFVFRPSSSIPIKEVLRAIVILGALGILGYAISAVVKSTLGVYVLMAMLSFIAILVIVILIKTMAIRTEYQIVRAMEGV